MLAVTLTTAGFLVGAGGGAPAIATARTSESAPVPSPEHTQTDSPTQVERYWTPERMAAASRVQVSDAASGGPGEHNDATGTVVSTTGVAFLTTDEGDQWCAASALASANHDVVVTTADCVRASGPTGAFYQNWAFAPGFHEGQTPYGIWPARGLQVTRNGPNRRTRPRSCYRGGNTTGGPWFRTFDRDTGRGHLFCVSNWIPADDPYSIRCAPLGQSAKQIYESAQEI